jgi:hypothetical protein
MSPMNPRLLRPSVSGIHPDAMDWRTRVIANGGTVDGATMSAVSGFCRRIDAGGLRDRFYRLNLFCGNGLTAALVPLYRSESRTATARGNTTDTNNGPFVSADYNNTGSSSGLKGNGTNKALDTGLPANSLSGNNIHMGFGLRETQTGASAFKTLGGIWTGVDRSYIMFARRADNNLNCEFGTGNVASSTAGEQVNSASLGVGDVIMAFPSFYRNGAVAGTSATTSQNYPNADRMVVFAMWRASTSNAINQTDARINWYSIGLAMTAAQVLSFYNAIAAFNTALSRT